jgi:hypothetical protein
VAELEERVAFYSEQRDNMQQAALELGPKIDELQQKLAVAEAAFEKMRIMSHSWVIKSDTGAIEDPIHARYREVATAALAEIRKARVTHE